VRLTLDRDYIPDCKGFALMNIDIPKDVCEGGLADDDDSVLYNTFEPRRAPTAFTTPFPPAVINAPTAAPTVASTATVPPTAASTEVYVSQRVTCQAALAPPKAFTFDVKQQVHTFCLIFCFLVSRAWKNKLHF